MERMRVWKRRRKKNVKMQRRKTTGVESSRPPTDKLSQRLQFHQAWKYINSQVISCPTILFLNYCLIITLLVYQLPRLKYNSCTTKLSRRSTKREEGRRRM